MEEFKLIKLRKGVSGIIFRDGKFLMVAGKDWPEGAWCFPQGGINPGETHLKALRREILEEIGNSNFEILSKSNHEHMYLFPEKIRLKKGFHGQYQTIWFVQFLDKLENIQLQDEELNKYYWFNRSEIIENMMYPEQKEIFQKILKEFDRLKEEKIL